VSPYPSTTHEPPAHHHSTRRDSGAAQPQEDLTPVRKPDYNRRVVVTGMGVVSPIGNDLDTVWDNLVNGRSGIGEITRFDATPYEHKAAGEVRDFDVTKFWNFKDARRTEATVHYAVAAARMAVADSGLEINDSNHYDVGVIFGSGGGGQALFIANQEGWRARGVKAVSPFFIANGLVDASSGTIAIETGAKGHNFCPVSACSTGTTAIGEAAEAIRRGDCTAVITGSSESPLLELVHVGFTNMRGMGTPLPGQPIGTVCRPFDRTRDGFVLGEGAGGLILEDLELAKARGARIYAEIVGYGSAADGFDMIAPAENGEGSARAMKMALERRGVPADEVDMINPHGTSTPLGDKRESEAIWLAFGDHTPDILISATKSMTGHMMGAAGAFEGIATVLSVFHQTVPGTLNYREPDPECNVTIATETVEKPLRYALSNNIGLGGHNAAVIFSRYMGD
jgi:3-oxoacyl-[acyl-carrier-protein] synthase II